MLSGAKQKMANKNKVKQIKAGEVYEMQDEVGAWVYALFPENSDKHNPIDYVFVDDKVSIVKVEKSQVCPGFINIQLMVCGRAQPTIGWIITVHPRANHFKFWKLAVNSE